MTILADVDLEKLRINLGKPDQIRTNSIDLTVDLPEGADCIMPRGESRTVSTIEKIGCDIDDRYEFHVHTKSTMFRLGVDCHAALGALPYLSRYDMIKIPIEHRSYAFDTLLARGDSTVHLIVREKSSPYVSQEELLNCGDYMTLYRKPDRHSGKASLSNLEMIKADDLVFDGDRLVLTVDVTKGFKAKKPENVPPLKMITGTYLKDLYWEEVGGRNDEIELERDAFYIFSTKEVIHLKSVCGIDSTYCKRFAGKRLGGVIDCGFIGSLNMNMHSSKDQVIYDGQPLALVEIDGLSSTPKALYGADNSSHYQMSLEPTLAKIFKK